MRAGKPGWGCSLTGKTAILHIVIPGSSPVVSIGVFCHVVISSGSSIW